MANLRVVLAHNVDVHLMRHSNIVTCITGFNNVNGRAVFADNTKANGLAHLEVSATSINDPGVGSGKLVTAIAQSTKKKTSTIG